MNIAFARFTTPRFGTIASPSPDTYAKPAAAPPGAKTALWIPDANPKKPFLSWNHSGHSAVHALTVFKNAANQWMVRFLVQNRPAMGGIDTVEAPAGKYADTDPTETAQLAAGRELEEETGLRPKKVMMLSEDGDDSNLGACVATSPGITNERKAFALILAEDVGAEKNLTENEKKQNVRQLDVLLSRFLSPQGFKQWREDLKLSGKLLGVDIPALRGLLPTRRELKAFLES